MATRADVESAIETIENNGNNTAKEVRDVLTTLLNYTENDPQEFKMTPFEFNNNKKPTKDGNAQLLYSFRGFEKFTVNFTFRLNVTRKTPADFEFQIEPDLFPVLKELIKPGHLIPFAVPFARRSDSSALTHIDGTQLQFMPLTMIVGLKDPDKLLVKIPKVEMQKSDILHSSVQFHVPNFMDF